MNTVDILGNKAKNSFKDLLAEVYVSLDPPPESQFYCLFFGTNWDLYQQIHSEMLEQLEIHKHLEKGQLVTFNMDYRTKANMARGDGVVRGEEYTPYPFTPKKPDYRDINPSNRILPVSRGHLGKLQ